MTLPKSEILLSLPPIMCAQRAQCDPRRAEAYFATCDPPAQQLGSGGGAAHVLHQAWRAAGASRSLEDWLARGSRIVVHGGGESRRLPAYAPLGKLSLPIPALRWARGQRLGQTLLDLNSPFLRQALDASDGQACVLIASGDVLLRAPRGLPALPQADVVMLGMWAPPETAQHYGVLFCDRHDPQRLVTFLQKPSPDEIRERSRETAFLIDVGAWLLSPRAVASLLQQCGWQRTSQDFGGSAVPRTYDLYGQWALHLGDAPLQRHAEVSGLSAAVAPVSAGEFYHFGSTRDVVESIYELQNAVRDQSLLGPVPSLAQPKQFIQDAQFGVPVRRQENDALWVENCCIPDTWSLSRRHMLTGVPPNAWRLRLAEGTCLDFVPIGDADVAVRCYGYDDRFRGPLGDPHTQWLERPAGEWFAVRGIAWHDAHLDPETDLQRAALFPVWPIAALDERVLQWLIDPTPESAAGGAERDAWLRARRLSARELTQEANLTRLTAQREAFRREGLQAMVRHGAQSVLYKLDLADTAQYFAASNAALPPLPAADRDLMLAVHDRMFRSEVRRLRQDPAWDEEQRAAFQTLAAAIIDRHRESPTLPQCDLAPDQIVWARSPIRVDLAGGWTDTPPYCLEQGGSVANIALNLNGQPPIQVFARRSAELTLRIRSIDLGLGEEIVDYEQLGNWHEIGNGFAIARAALALCGFHPQFHGGAYATLAEQLRAFGGGVDLSLLAAVPKGSGLGASSILAGATLGALNELCSLGWDVASVADRVSAVEQMLGSGGGWQDQFGGLLPGAKLLETEAGLRQRVSCRWLPSEFFAELLRADRLLLYYTGVTRVAHNVLGEIVRGMFLNDPERLDLLAAIGANGRACFEAVQRGEIDAFARCIQRSWELNQALDSGTNPPEVAAIVERAAPYASGLKLAGAGGGGFLFVVTRDQQASMRLRRDLETAPPNPRARFVHVSVSTAGLEVTRS